jgi:hypothetical protein
VLGRPDARTDLESALELSERAGFEPFVQRARDRLAALGVRSSRG